MKVDINKRLQNLTKEELIAVIRENCSFSLQLQDIIKVQWDMASTRSIQAYDDYIKALQSAPPYPNHTAPKKDRITYKETEIKLIELEEKAKSYGKKETKLRAELESLI